VRFKGIWGSYMDGRRVVSRHGNARYPNFGHFDADKPHFVAIQALVDKLMSGGLTEFEPPNPIQGAIAQLIQGMAQQKMNTIDATVTDRGPNGQFTSVQET
jgi:hypothetical protein